EESLPSVTPAIPHLIGHVRNQGKLPRPLDRGLQLPLMHRTGARDAPRQDFAAFGYERAEQLRVFVIDIVDLVRAELADLPAPEHRPPLLLLFVGALLVAAPAAAPSPSSSHRHR